MKKNDSAQYEKIPLPAFQEIEKFEPEPEPPTLAQINREIFKNRTKKKWLKLLQKIEKNNFDPLPF